MREFLLNLSQQGFSTVLFCLINKTAEKPCSERFTQPLLTRWKILKCGPQGGKKEEADGDIELQILHLKRNPVSSSKPFLLYGYSIWV